MTWWGEILIAIFSICGWEYGHWIRREVTHRRRLRTFTVICHSCRWRHDGEVADAEAWSILCAHLALHNRKQLDSGDL